MGCCFEMDIWEANKQATAFTPHPCSVEGPYRCEGTACGDGAKGERYMGVCDKDGCDLNAYRMGAHEQFGMGSDFVTTDGTDQGDLAEIRRLYVQGGKLIAHANSTSAAPRRRLS